MRHKSKTIFISSNNRQNAVIFPHVLICIINDITLDIQCLKEIGIKIAVLQVAWKLRGACSRNYQ